MSHSTIADINNDLSYNIVTVEALGITLVNNILNININLNVNADSTASITVAKNGYDSTLTQSLLPINTVISIKSNVNGVNKDLFKGKLKSISNTAENITYNISDDFNLFVKRGLIKELDFINENDRNNIFEITGTPTIADYSNNFDTACKYNGAYYYNNGGDYGNILTFTRVVFNKANLVTKVNQAKLITIDVMSASGYSLDYSDASAVSNTVNVYDLLYNIRFKRYSTFIKDIALDSDLNLPAGIRTTYTTTPPSGTPITKYKTYDRPARVSAIKEAIESAGWTIDQATVAQSFITSNILDVNGTDIIYSALQNDDVGSFSCKCYRESEQEVILPIIVRIVNNTALSAGNPVSYKRIDKTFTYTSSKPTYNSTNFSGYVDAFDWTGTTHMNLVNSAIAKMKFEMQGINNLFDGKITSNLIIANSALYNNDSLPFDTKQALNPDIHTSSSIMDINLGDCLKIDTIPFIILTKSFNFDMTNGLSMLSINGNIVSSNLTSGGGSSFTLPDPIAIFATSAPHDATGSGLLQVNGTSTEWTNDLSWAFENDVTLTRYYSHFISPSSLVENNDTEITDTNHYVHSVYVSSGVDETTLPFPASSSQCRIKNDKQKQIYTQAITVPPVILSDIIL